MSSTPLLLRTSVKLVVVVRGPKTWLPPVGATSDDTLFRADDSDVYAQVGP